MRDLRRHERMLVMARNAKIHVQESSLGNLGRAAGFDPSYASFLN